MIKEKYIGRLTFILILSSIIICLSIHFYYNNIPEILEIPEYIAKVFNKDEVIEINISISEENFESLIENALLEEYVVADITINDTTINNIGIRAKGNSSLSQVANNSETDRFSFKIKFSEYIDDQNLYGLEKMVLNNMISDATYLQEYMAYELMEFIGVNTPAYAFANIKINGEDWGFYLAIEVLEEDFLERYYGKDYGVLYKPEPSGVGGMAGGDDNRNQQPPPTIPDQSNTQVLEEKGDTLIKLVAPTGEIQPPIGEIQPPIGEMQPPIGEMQPPIGEMQPPTGEMQPPIGEMQPPTGEMQPPTGITGSKSQEEFSGSRGDTTQITPEQFDQQNNVNMEKNLDTNLFSEDTLEVDLENVDNTHESNILEKNQQNRFGGGRGNSDPAASLSYIDDDPSSYSIIFDSVVTKNLTEADKLEYIQMVYALNNGGDIEKYLDVDEVLRYFAVNTFLVNMDSYTGSNKHNYYLYEKNGVFQILPWDFNISFGTFQVGNAQTAINFPIDIPITDSVENCPLIMKLLEVDEYKELYYYYLNEIVENYINNGIFESRVNQLNDLIHDYVANDQTAFYTIEEYELGVENLILYAKDRAKSISLQLAGLQPSDKQGDLETNVNLSALGGLSGMGGKPQLNGQNLKGNIPEEPSLGNAQMEVTQGNNKNFGPNGKIDFNVPTKTTQNSINLIEIGIVIIIITVGLIFIITYKRNKYNV